MRHLQPDPRHQESIERHPYRAPADESALGELLFDLERFLERYVPTDWDARQALVTESVLSYLRTYGELSFDTREQCQSARRLLFCVAKNAAIDWLRMDKLRRLRTETDHSSREDDDTFRDLIRLHETLQALTDDERDLLHLRYWRDLDSVEIGRRFGISRWTVRRRLKRLLAFLRSQLSRSS